MTVIDMAAQHDFLNTMYTRKRTFYTINHTNVQLPSVKYILMIEQEGNKVRVNKAPPLQR